MACGMPSIVVAERLSSTSLNGPSSVKYRSPSHCFQSSSYASTSERATNAGRPARSSSDRNSSPWRFSSHCPRACPYAQAVCASGMPDCGRTKTRAPSCSAISTVRSSGSPSWTTMISATTPSMLRRQRSITASSLRTATTAEMVLGPSSATARPWEQRLADLVGDGAHRPDQPAVHDGGDDERHDVWEGREHGGRGRSGGGERDRRDALQRESLPAPA